uniref:TIGR03668 family PPOX class F420-dependent oxidoreductase n=1 Tax=Gordonia sp. B7-2 TaxID=3420932 RepID=UPI003D93029D
MADSLDDEMHQRFVEARVARLSSVTRDARPHIVPIVFAVNDNTIVTCVDHKPKRTNRLPRLDNIRENPNVAVLVDHYAENWDELWWVRVDGRAEVVDASETRGRHGIDVLADKYEHYRRRRPDGPVIIVDALRWHSWSGRPSSAG